MEQIIKSNHIAWRGNIGRFKINGDDELYYQLLYPLSIFVNCCME